MEREKRLGGIGMKRGEEGGRENAFERNKMHEPLTNGSCMSYKSRGYEVEGIAGVERKINNPQKLGEPLLGAKSTHSVPNYLSF
jgi:hypothetical protein